jgi:hypothetical protein
VRASSAHPQQRGAGRRALSNLLGHTMKHHQFKVGEHVFAEQGSLRHGIRRRLRSHVPGAGDSSRVAIPHQAKHRMLPTGFGSASAAKRRVQSTNHNFLRSAGDDSCIRAIARWENEGRAALPGSGKTLDEGAQVAAPDGRMPVHRRAAAISLWDAISSKVWRNLHEREQSQAGRS